jgi:hypothetical protein
MAGWIEVQKARGIMHRGYHRQMRHCKAMDIQKKQEKFENCKCLECRAEG